MGGASLSRFIHWNVCTGRETTYNPQKSSLMMCSQATIISLNETRINMKLKGYSSFSAIPSIQLNGLNKLNAMILVRDDIDTKLVHS